MIIDPKNALTITSQSPKSQTNNTGGFLMDCTNYEGLIAVNISIGTKTVGDADGAIAIGLATSATNNISNATNYTPLIGSATVSTSNNATVSGQITFDPRDNAIAGKYVFTRVAVSGTNSPAYPISVVAVGTQRVQPGS